VRYLKLNRASELIRLRIALIIGGCLVASFMVADYMLLPADMHQLYTFDRLLLQLPIIFLMVAGSYWRGFAQYKHYFFTFLLIALTYSNYWLIWVCWHNFKFDFPYEGTILYAYYCVFALGIPFKMALMASTVNVIGFAVLMYIAPVYGDRVLISTAFVGGSLFVCAYAKYRLDRSLTLLEETNHKLLKLSKYDPLSNLLNRRALREESTKLLAFSRRHNASIAILMIDLDDFKKYNDSFGHQQGDEAIRRQSAMMKAVFKRESDILGRYGGEEFIVVLSGVTEAQVKERCEALLQAWKDEEIPHAKDAQHNKMSCSIGAVLINNSESTNVDLLINDADKALYQAKEAGKACYVLSPRR